MGIAHLIYKEFQMKRIICCVSLVLSTSVFADNLIQFQSGQPAKASEVNANFSELEDRISDASNQSSASSITTRIVTDTVVGLASTPWYSELGEATCPANTVITGGSIDCASAQGNVNAGTTMRATFAGNTMLGYCYAPEDNLFSTLNRGPTVVVYAICAEVGSASLSSISKTRAEYTYDDYTSSDDTPEQGEMNEAAIKVYDEFKEQIESRVNAMRAAAEARGE